MSEETTEATEPTEAKKEFSVNILISEQSLSYRSDFNEAETIFWLEAVKDLILRKSFEALENNS